MNEQAYLDHIRALQILLAYEREEITETACCQMFGMFRVQFREWATSQYCAAMNVVGEHRRPIGKGGLFVHETPLLKVLRDFRAGVELHGSEIQQWEGWLRVCDEMNARDGKPPVTFCDNCGHRPCDCAPDWDAKDASGANDGGGPA